ncbi:hypothetical protein Scani_76350 [Streptomyces caniferus]|uniref:Uncharacterized protein n=1 Tax=Streptomyces caniferus TaxID=285557 RepID=A0A640SJF8_9ACTN|nr:hypothetical protein Scani_76350 [Streptomyces caniferus]
MAGGVVLRGRGWAEGSGRRSVRGWAGAFPAPGGGIETWSQHSGWAYRYAAPPFDQGLVEPPGSGTFDCRTQELIWRPVPLHRACPLA